MTDDDFKTHVTDSLARLETHVNGLVTDVREHRDRLTRVEKIQFRFGALGSALVLALTAAGLKASTAFHALLAAFGRG